MEKTDKLALIELASDWKDLGSWKSVYDVSKKDEDDILLALKDLESRLKNSDSITFCGQPASDEAIDGILHSIKAGISLAISDIKRK